MAYLGEEKKIFFENEFQYKNQGKSNLDISGFFEDHCGRKGFIFCFVLKNLINDMIWPIESAQLCFQSIAVKIIAELSRAQHGSPETNASLYGKGGHNAV